MGSMPYTLDLLEIWLGRLGGLAALLTLALALWRLVSGLGRQAGLATGRTGWLRSRRFYLIGTAIFLGLCILLWRPLPVSIIGTLRLMMLAGGTLLLLGGLGLYIWGLLKLGAMMGGATSFGAALYADHRLVTSGPYAIIRHPMYAGLILASLGGLLLYRTWTTAFLFTSFTGLALRARREEEILSRAFGAAWDEYKRRVPGWFPRLRRH
jgi:protein-S-isoprenylcysteine O-methyltransferase Ste14